MKGKIFFIAAALIVVFSVLFFIFRQSSPVMLTDLIRIETPLANTLVKSPLIVRGEARGTWFFEASFPIHLLTDDGEPIAIAIAQAQDEWMTENFVPFEATVDFTTDAASGFLLLLRDNPSWLPENDKQIKIPVRFR